MPNMPHCRFHNTAADVRECLEHIDDELSDVEHNARRTFISLCHQVAASCEVDEFGPRKKVTR